MNSLKNAIVTVTLLAVGYGSYIVLSEPLPERVPDRTAIVDGSEVDLVVPDPDIQVEDASPRPFPPEGNAQSDQPGFANHLNPTAGQTIQLNAPSTPAQSPESPNGLVSPFQKPIPDNAALTQNGPLPLQISPEPGNQKLQPQPGASLPDLPELPDLIQDPNLTALDPPGSNQPSKNSDSRGLQIESPPVPGGNGSSFSLTPPNSGENQNAFTAPIEPSVSSQPNAFSTNQQSPMGGPTNDGALANPFEAPVNKSPTSFASPNSNLADPSTLNPPLEVKVDVGEPDKELPRFETSDSDFNTFGNAPLVPTAPVLPPATQQGNAAFEKVWDEVLKFEQVKDLGTALKLLTPWNVDSDLSDEQGIRCLRKLDELAGKVIYSRNSYLEPAYQVKAGETLDEIAAAYRVPLELLARINGIAAPYALSTGESLKVIRGPFRADVSLGNRELTLYTGAYYAGRFSVNVGRDLPPEEAFYEIAEKTAGRSYFDRRTGRELLRGQPENRYGNYWLGLRGQHITTGHRVGIHGRAKTAAGEDVGCISLNENDAGDVFAILSVGSRIQVRR